MHSYSLGRQIGKELHLAKLLHSRCWIKAPLREPLRILLLFSKSELWVLWALLFPMCFHLMWSSDFHFFSVLPPLAKCQIFGNKLHPLTLGFAWFCYHPTSLYNPFKYNMLVPSFQSTQIELYLKLQYWLFWVFFF